MEKEKKYLKETYELVDKLKKENLQNIINAPKKYSGNKNIAIRDAMLYMYKQKKEKLDRIGEKPYFARIDFKEKDHESSSKYYIGKADIVDKNDIKVVDWRAPIASLYYDNHLGEIDYYVENEKIHGNLELKRQYIIENKNLIEYMDVEEWTEDEMLKPYLSANSDIRLKNIVSTIQKEQNEIIRKNINKNCIVQGVAGSGKTTVALHKIAYLVYTYIDKIKESEYMVIGPNKFFLNYISSVLPDLDVAEARELTYEELAENYIKEKLKITKGYTEYAKYKCSLECKNDIDIFYEEYLNNYFENINKQIHRLNIMQFVDNVKSEEILKNKVEKIIFGIDSFLKLNNEKIIEKIKRMYERKILKNKEKDKREIYKERNEEIRYLETELFKIVKKSFKLPKAIDIYNEFLKTKNINKIEKNKIKIEDLAGIIYFKYLIEGKKDYNNIRHVVVDEAQDFGLFNIFVLTKIFKNSTFSIFGDSAQSIHSYRSMDSLFDCEKVIKDAEKMILSKSYRTTIEISNTANKILKKLNLPLANAVIRHGKEVLKIRIKDRKEIIDKIKEYQKSNYKTIAIICKDKNEIDSLYTFLEKNNIEVSKMDKDNLTYTTGICLLTPEFAKGLEFDAVIVSDMSEYDLNSKIDLKRIYVAITRAMHELTIFHSMQIDNIL